MSLETTTPTAEAGIRVRVLYQCHACSQGSNVIEVPASEHPGIFKNLVIQAVKHHHTGMSPHCPKTRFKVKFVDPGPL
jgi:hypothetical protein